VKAYANQLHMANATVSEAYNADMDLSAVTNGDADLSLLHYYGLMVEACVAIGESLAYKYYKVTFANVNSAGANTLEGTLEDYMTFLQSNTLTRAKASLNVDSKLTQWPVNHHVRSNLWRDADARVSALGRSASMLRRSNRQTMRLVRAVYVASYAKVEATYREMVANDWAIANNALLPAAPIPARPARPIVNPVLDYDAIFGLNDEVVAPRDPEWMREMKTNLVIVASYMAGSNIERTISEVVESVEWTEFRLATCKQHSIRLASQARNLALMDPHEASEVLKATSMFTTSLKEVHSKIASGSSGAMMV